MTDPVSLTSPVRLHCETIGAGPDLVFLHGLFGSGENWRGQAKRLASDYTIHSMDLRNHGASPHTPTMNYPAMAADVIHTGEALGLHNFHLLGHSMGGKTAMQLALTYPSRINQLIIVDIGPKQYPHHHVNILDGLQELQTTLLKSELKSRLDADTLLANKVDNAAVRSFLLKNLQRTESGQYELCINLDVIVDCYNDIAAAIAPATFTPRREPTLFIKGAESDYLQAEDQQSVLVLFPGAKLKTISGAGHWPQSEKPDVVYKIIQDFLT